MEKYNKIWEVEKLRSYTINNKSKVHIYGIIYSKTIINPKTKMYDDDFIESHVKANTVFRDITKKDIFSSMQLCFQSTKEIKSITIKNGKIQPIA